MRPATLSSRGPPAQGCPLNPEGEPFRGGAEERPLRRCACPTSLILLPLTMQVAARAVELRGGLDDDEELRYLVAEDDL